MAQSLVSTKSERLWAWNYQKDGDGTESAIHELLPHAQKGSPRACSLTAPVPCGFRVAPLLLHRHKLKSPHHQGLCPRIRTSQGYMSLGFFFARYVDAFT
jgi:hypothetical protein